MPIVCVLGAPPDNPNLGLGALAQSIVAGIHRLEPETRIVFLHGGRQAVDYRFIIDGTEHQSRSQPYCLSPRGRLRDHLLIIFLSALIFHYSPSIRLRQAVRRWIPWIELFLEASWIADIRGGDSFSDLYGWRRFVIGSIPNLVAILLGRKVTYLPQSYGPFQAGWMRRLAAFLLERAEFIITREVHGARAVREIAPSVELPAVRMCPDLAFALPPRRAEHDEIVPALPGAGPLIGLNVSGLLAMNRANTQKTFGISGDYLTLIRSLIERLISLPDVHLLLIPHVLGEFAESDPVAIRRLGHFSAKSHGRIHRLLSVHDAAQTKALIGRCDFFLGSRMHACIGALSQGVPTVGLAYSDKFRGVFEALALGDLALDLRRLHAAEIFERCVEAYQQRASLRLQIQEQLPAVISTIEATFTAMTTRPHCTPQRALAQPEMLMTNNAWPRG